MRQRKSSVFISATADDADADVHNKMCFSDAHWHL